MDSNHPIASVPSDALAFELLQSGILSDSDPQHHIVNFGKKTEIELLLSENGINFEKNLKKTELVDLCLEKIPEKSRERFGENFPAIVPSKFRLQNIKYYLHRKFDYELVYDENMVPVSIPVLQTQLPDDLVTEQLRKRGYYAG